MKKKNTYKYNDFQHITLVIFVVLCALFALSFFRYSLVDSFSVLFSVLSSVVLLVPIIFSKSKIDLVQPLSFVLLSVLLGITLRTIFIVETAASRAHTAEVLLLNNPTEFIFLPNLVVLVCMILLVVGYKIKAQPIKFSFFNVYHSKKEWSKKRLNYVTILFVILSGYMATLYAKKMGILSLDITNFAKKRWLELEGSEYKATLAYYIWFANLIKPTFLVFLTYFAASKQKWLSRDGLITVLLGIASILFPIFVSSRTQVMLTFISAGIVWYYFRKVKILPVATFIIVASAIFYFQSLARSIYDDIDQLQKQTSEETFAATLVGNLNMFGISKTAAILEYVPQRLEYQYGATFTTVLIAPIPRTVWRAKPVINSGPIIGKNIYGFANTGVPPAMVGELYLNFGYTGVFFGMFLLGRVFKYFYVSFKEGILSKNKNAIVFYAFLIYDFSFTLIGASFTQAVVSLLQSIISISVILFLIRDRQKTKRIVIV